MSWRFLKWVQIIHLLTKTPLKEINLKNFQNRREMFEEPSSETSAPPLTPPASAPDWPAHKAGAAPNGALYPAVPPVPPVHYSHQWHCSLQSHRLHHILGPPPMCRMPRHCMLRFPAPYFGPPVHCSVPEHALTPLTPNQWLYCIIFLGSHCMGRVKIWKACLRIGSPIR